MKRDLADGEVRAILRYAARRMQGRTERFTGPKARTANALLRDPNRKGFKVPDVREV